MPTAVMQQTFSHLVLRKPSDVVDQAIGKNDVLGRVHYPICAILLASQIYTSTGQQASCHSFFSWKFYKGLAS